LGSSLQAIACSEEPKAAETAEIIAARLGIASQTEPGLAEHDRGNVPMMKTRDFISAMAHFFNRPRQLVLGRETAEQARKRFGEAIDRLLARHGQDDLAVVTHGTVLALYAAPLIDADAFTLWRQMGLPSYLVFDRPSMVLVDRCDQPASAE
jgi:broad specificity phosphatase PhoE